MIKHDRKVWYWNIQQTSSLSSYSKEKCHCHSGRFCNRKTELLRMISDYENNGISSGITKYVKTMCSNRKRFLERKTCHTAAMHYIYWWRSTILRSKEFTRMVKGSDNYFVWSQGIVWNIYHIVLKKFTAWDKSETVRNIKTPKEYIMKLISYIICRQRGYPTRSDNNRRL